MANQSYSVLAKMGIDIGDFKRGLAEASNIAGQFQKQLKGAGLRSAAKFLGPAAAAYALREFYTVAFERANKLQEQQDEQIKKAEKFVELTKGTGLYAGAVEKLSALREGLDENTLATLRFQKASKGLWEGIADGAKNAVGWLARSGEYLADNAKFVYRVATSGASTVNQAFADASSEANQEANAEKLLRKQEQVDAELAARQEELFKQKVQNEKDLAAAEKISAERMESYRTTQQKRDNALAVRNTALTNLQGTNPASMHYGQAQLEYEQAAKHLDEAQERLDKEEKDISEKKEAALERQREILQKISDLAAHVAVTLEASVAPSEAEVRSGGRGNASQRRALTKADRLQAQAQSQYDKYLRDRGEYENGSGSGMQRDALAKRGLSERAKAAELAKQAQMVREGVYGTKESIDADETAAAVREESAKQITELQKINRSLEPVAVI